MISRSLSLSLSLSINLNIFWLNHCRVRLSTDKSQFIASVYGFHLHFTTNTFLESFFFFCMRIHVFSGIFHRFISVALSALLLMFFAIAAILNIYFSSGLWYLITIKWYFFNTHNLIIFLGKRENNKKKTQNNSRLRVFDKLISVKSFLMFMFMFHFALICSILFYFIRFNASPRAAHRVFRFRTINYNYGTQFKFEKNSKTCFGTKW